MPADTHQSDRHIAAADGQLIDAISSLWQKGWTPSDLITYLAFAHSQVELQLVRHAIATEHDLSAYGDLISPLWHRQLQDVTTGAGPTRPVLRFIERGGSIEDAVYVAMLLSALPPFAPVTEPPGKGVLGVVRAPNDDPLGQPTRDPDPGLLRRVRALLAKAESTEYAAEAEAFTEKAQELITLHSLHAMLADVGTEFHGPAAIRLATERPYAKEKFLLIGQVARANRCQAIGHQGFGLVTVIGFQVDLDAVDLLYTSLLVQATRAMHEYGKVTNERGESTTRSFRKSFLVGFASRIGERLKTAAANATEHIANDDNGRLLPALASQDAAVERHTTQLFPNTTKARTSHATDRHGWSAGVAAANAADLGRRKPLTS